MAEYIDRDMLINDLIGLEKELFPDHKEFGPFDLGILQGATFAITKTKSIPTEDVQPVKHGRWVFYKPPDDWIKMHLSPKSFYVCDICGNIEDGKQNYCSHCGAKMEGET